MTFRQWYYLQPAGKLEQTRKELIDLISPNMPQVGKNRLYSILKEQQAPKPLEQAAIRKYCGVDNLEFPTNYKPKKKRAPKSDLFTTDEKD